MHYREVTRNYDVSEVADRLLSLRNRDCLGRVLDTLEKLYQLTSLSSMSNLIPIMISD
jgi:hypothetical protein